MDGDDPNVRRLKAILMVVFISAAAAGFLFRQDTIAMAIGIPVFVAWIVVCWLSGDEDILE